MVYLASLCGCRSRKTREYPFLMIFISCFLLLGGWCSCIFEFVMYPFVFSFVNMHDCGFFMLQNCKTYHCREDGVIEMLDYNNEDILDIIKTLLYTRATSDVFDVDFRGLYGIEPCTYA